MERLIKRFHAAGYEVIFSSAAGFTERSAKIPEVSTWKEIKLNCDSFDEFILDLQPDLVMFDRFITEEQFGWRVAKNCPNTIKILDTEDLHFLRKGREKAVKKGVELSDEFLFTDEAKREIASIYRCDLSLIISSFEMSLLINEFKIPPELLFYLPFQLTQEDLSLAEHTLSFSERSGFMTIGNFKHAPNLDSARILKNTVWPEVRKLLPTAEFHLYGSYPTQEIFKMHEPDQGFFVHGIAKDVKTVFSSARVCLAPLRFGAGLKGKFLEAMLYNTPIATTSLGAEGMFESPMIPGIVSNDYKTLAQLAVALHEGEALWEEKSALGRLILEKDFTQPKGDDELINEICELEKTIATRRKTNFMGQILQFHTLRSTEFMSRFIQEKNKFENK